jgi:hypothetical protein
MQARAQGRVARQVVGQLALGGLGQAQQAREPLALMAGLRHDWSGSAQRWSCK